VQGPSVIYFLNDLSYRRYFGGDVYLCLRPSRREYALKAKEQILDFNLHY
jgi:hypothetical protein